ncbi:MAG TPA: carboxypeptidase-like regulatory domain-containing protein [Solirubrobacteraceae bacterium]
MGRVLTSLSAVAVAALAPAVARAGEYPIDFCKGWTNDAPAVQLPFAHSFPGGVNNDCSRGGPEGGLHGMIPGGIMQFDSHSVILLQVPADRPGIVIKRVASQYAAPGTSGSLAFVRVMAGGALLDNQVAPHAPSEDRLLPAGARDLSWGIYCSTSGSTYCYVPTAGDVFHVYKARLFLSESADPTVTVTGGSLIGGGPKAGPRTLLVDAFDGDSGILGMTVKLDDTVVGDIPYQCAYDDWSACRRDRQGQVLDIDTTKVLDGVHALSLVVRDAAGNQTRKELGEVRVANSPSPAAQREAGVARGRALIRLGRSRLTVSSGRSAIIRGRLVDDDDRPIPDATIQIDERAYIPKTGLIGPAWASLGYVLSDASGRFSARIPPGASRALRFSYAAAGVADSAEARVSVRAGVTLRVSRRVARNGSSVRFTGTVAGALPRAGVLVTLQGHVPGRGWRAVDSTPNVGRAGANGRFRMSYRFLKTSQPTRFRFRVLVNEDSAFAYTRAASRPVTVAVFPPGWSIR